MSNAEIQRKLDSGGVMKATANVSMPSLRYVGSPPGMKYCVQVEVTEKSDSVLQHSTKWEELLDIQSELLLNIKERYEMWKASICMQSNLSYYIRDQRKIQLYKGIIEATLQSWLDYTSLERTKLLAVTK